MKNSSLFLELLAVLLQPDFLLKVADKHDNISLTNDPLVKVIELLCRAIYMRDLLIKATATL